MTTRYCSEQDSHLRLPTSVAASTAAPMSAHSTPALIRGQPTAGSPHLAADGVALHSVEVGDGGAAQREELAPQQLAPAGEWFVGWHVAVSSCTFGWVQLGSRAVGPVHSCRCWCHAR